MQLEQKDEIDIKDKLGDIIYAYKNDNEILFIILFLYKKFSRTEFSKLNSNAAGWIRYPNSKIQTQTHRPNKYFLKRQAT